MYTNTILCILASYTVFKFEFAMLPRGSKEREEAVLAATSAIQAGQSVRSAAKQFGLPYSTLQDHCSGKYCNTVAFHVHKRALIHTGKSETIGAGRPTILTPAEEKEIVVTCQVLQELGYGLSREMVGEVISSFIADQKRQSPFKDGVPGKDWWRGFLKRWPSLSERKPQHLSKRRADAANPEVLESWFASVQSFLQKVELMKRNRTVPDYASRIWNCDETGFCLGATSKKILAKRGERCVHEVGGGSDHQFITVNACGNAAGIKLPPFILYKGKHLYSTWTNGGPAGTHYGVSESGWMEEINFLKWFEQQFYPAVKHLTTSGPVVLFFDGHYSHMSISLIKKARSLQIHLFCLPPNMTHVLQPFDVGVFAPVKAKWRIILKRYKLQSRAMNVTKECFPRLIKQLWEQSITVEHLQGGFSASGIVPFNPQAIKPSRLAPSLKTPAQQVRGEVSVVGTLATSTAETPIRVELRGYFQQLLKAAEKDKPQRRQRIQLQCTGELLTSDEVLERLEKAEAEKAEKAAKKVAAKRGKKGKSTGKASSTSDEPETYCHGCNQLYSDNQAADWIGCDNCDSWWHYWCASLDKMLAPEEEWLCEDCS